VLQSAFGCLFKRKIEATCEPSEKYHNVILVSRVIRRISSSFVPILRLADIGPMLKYLVPDASWFAKGSKGIRVMKHAVIDCLKASPPSPSWFRELESYFLNRRSSLR